jgi:hypothetical protein
MTEYSVAPWVVVVIIVSSIWRAFHGPHSDDWWRSTKSWWQAMARR